VVDDASPDGTLEVAQQLQKLYGEDHIVRVDVRGYVHLHAGILIIIPIPRYYVHEAGSWD
jgi:glycosyltransferase involved in cell wall biosynthesis